MLWLHDVQARVHGPGLGSGGGREGGAGEGRPSTRAHVTGLPTRKTLEGGEQGVFFVVPPPRGDSQGCENDVTGKEEA